MESILTQITREMLMESIEHIEFLNDYEDVGLWDSLCEVLAYYSTEEELLEYDARKLNPEWIKTVLRSDFDRLLEAGV